MSRRLCTIPVHVLLLAGLIPAASGGETPVSEVANPSPVKTSVSVSGHTVVSESSSEVTFLGVETACAVPLEEEKGKLPSGVGLRVNYLVPGSPAAEHLRTGDVLVRLEEQILCNPSQLRTLVRVRKSGDAVRISFLRVGVLKEAMFTLKSIAVPRELTPVTRDFSSDVRIILNGEEISLRELFDDKWMVTRGWVEEHGAVIRPALEELPDEARELLQRMQELVEGNRRKLLQQLVGATGETEGHSEGLHPGIEKILEWAKPMREENGGGVNSSIKLFSASIVRDEKGTVTLKTENGSRHVTIADAQGKEVFSGPVNTDAERAVLSEEMRSRLQIVESLAEQCSPRARTRK